MKRLFLKLCWILPLVIGIAIFIVWLLTKNDFLMVLGIYDIYFGLCVSVIGLVYGSIGFIRSKGNKLERHRLLVALLRILSNLPVAIGILVAALAVATAYTVKVSNTSSSDVTNCVISGGGVEEDLGTVKAGTRTSRTFWIKQDGNLVVSYSIGDVKTEKQISDYVTNGMGGHDTVEIQ